MTASLPSTLSAAAMPAPFTVGSDDGIPFRMERTQALGNVVVPQIPELIGRAIITHENTLYRSHSRRDLINDSINQ
jgi:hypothetical protein